MTRVHKLAGNSDSVIVLLNHLLTTPCSCGVFALCNNVSIVPRAKCEDEDVACMTDNYGAAMVEIEHWEERGRRNEQQNL